MFATTIQRFNKIQQHCSQNSQSFVCLEYPQWKPWSHRKLLIYDQSYCHRGCYQILERLCWLLGMKKRLIMFFVITKMKLRMLDWFVIRSKKNQISLNSVGSPTIPRAWELLPTGTMEHSGGRDQAVDWQPGVAMVYGQNREAALVLPESV